MTTQIINWALARIAEKTTWLGIIGSVVTYLHLPLSTSLQESIANVLLAVVSAIAIFYKEKK
jgi:hypothetical protein